MLSLTALPLAIVALIFQTAPPSIVKPGAPGQPSTTLSAPPPSPAPKHTAADTKFMQGMIHHHAQAIEMVELLKTRTTRKDMQLLGKKIEVSQNDEIKMMKNWLKDRGEDVPMDHGGGQMMLMGAGGGMMAPMPGMLTEKQMAALAAAKGPAFDKLFLEGMIQHHIGALTMVEELFGTPGAGQESIIFDFASHVDADQRMDISRMRAMLQTKDKK
ncbi:MAG: DUF305 domain-containing protein [Acidobacteria bacterium]|nr:MAG: DUF305 domain-containing protein [Acidobacteriota bacterium]